ncbi:hypothetical protein [Streptomyces sp. NPDC056949]|uniref:hypothetical protein n=1 Tax=Streptomyces sp. NPDC056949 TaxID=3345976 RepID=UPI00363EF352
MREFGGQAGLLGFRLDRLEAGLGPFVALLGQDRGDQADQVITAGKVRPAISSGVSDHVTA